MLILKVISALLTYPQAELQEASDEIRAVVANEKNLPSREKAGLMALLDSWRDIDLVEWQQNYIELFDRGRALSLHIFEHIHGESRDRGQAMVELKQIYQTHGFEINTRELPDYIPLFLEYLSQRPTAEALEWLHGAMPVLSLLGVRLAERRSPYAALFEALQGLTGEPADLAVLREQAAAEGPDETLVRMDEIWEEETVNFLANPGSCQSRLDDVQPLKLTSRRDGATTHPTL